MRYSIHFRLINLAILAVYVTSILVIPVLAACSDIIDNTEFFLQETANNTRNLISSIYAESEDYGISKSDYSNLELEKQIPTYNLIDGDLVPTEISIFPLYSDRELIALITSFCVDDIVESMISTDYVEDISNYINGVYDKYEFVLVYDCNGIQVVTSQETNTIHEYSYDATFSNVYECNIEDEVNSILHNEALNDTDVMVITVNNEVMPYSTNGSGNVNLSVPRYNQGSTNLCWAYSVASIGNYLSSSLQYTGIEVAQELYGDNYNYGAIIDDALAVLDYLYGYYYNSQSSTLSESVLYDILYAGYPVYSHYTCSSGAHAVVLRAINTSTSYFSIMNPGTGTYQCFTNSSGNYTITYNSKSWTLNKWGYYYDQY